MSLAVDSFKLRDEGSVLVVGIYARASNANPEIIGDLWRRFYAAGGAGAIEARENDAVYCVYCEYEGDYTGGYTVLLGCAVDVRATVPDGMKRLEIEAGKFAIFEPAGELPKVVFETWAEIWKTPLNRRYHADYDRYCNDGSVTIHVGVL